MIHDEGITPLDIQNNPPMSIQGPITRAHARQLNLEVSSFLSTSLFGFVNRLLPYDYVMIMNQGENQEILKEGLGGMVDQQESPSRGGGPNQVDFEPFRSPGAVCTKTGLTDAYRLGFGCSLHIRKLKKTMVPMALVSGPNSSGVIGNHQRKLTSRI
jgi:hypothetical protein